MSMNRSLSLPKGGRTVGVVGRPSARPQRFSGFCAGKISKLCWNVSDWMASTANCKSLPASRPTHDNSKPKRKKKLDLS
jgi:hypothetical protein